MSGRRPIGGRLTGHEDWVVRAACRGIEDPGLFPESRDQHREAAGAIQRWCAGCEVVRECLAARHPQDRGCVRGACFIDDHGKLWPYNQLRHVQRRATAVLPSTAVWP